MKIDFADQIFALVRLGKYDQALELCNKLLPSEPRRCDWLGMRAYVHRSAGDAVRAYIDLRNAIECSDDPRPHLSKLARWLLEDGAYVECRTAAEKLVSLDRTAGSKFFIDHGLMILAMASWKLGDINRAKQLLDEMEDAENMHFGGQLVSKSWLQAEISKL
ncbi:MAG: hypothetical protein R3D51_17310 [Hyphomicrobiaceae bacterium]